MTEKVDLRGIAHGRTKTAIKAGKLVRQPCRSCGALPTQAHHNDYARPLDVRWLCSRCHYDEKDTP